MLNSFLKCTSIFAPALPAANDCVPRMLSALLSWHVRVPHTQTHLHWAWCPAAECKCLLCLVCWKIYMMARSLPYNSCNVCSGQWAHCHFRCPFCIQYSVSCVQVLVCLPGGLCPPNKH